MSKSKSSDNACFKDVQDEQEYLTGTKQKYEEADEGNSSNHLKEASLDPFDTLVLHEDVRSFITQHLKSKEFVKLSEVSPLWNEISESKLRLHLDVCTMAAKQLNNITRTYKKVSIKFGDNCDFSATLGNAIAELELNFNRVTCSTNFVESVALVDFVGKQKNLKCLKVVDHQDCMAAFSAIPTFQLNHLSCSTIDTRSPLLSSQRGTLQTLGKVIVFNKLQLCSILRDFPKLKKLEICVIYPLGYDSDNLPVNKKIKDLKVQTMLSSCKFDNFTQELLLALPELETLHVNELSTVMMEFVAGNMKKLQRLSYKSFEVGSLQRYLHMKLHNIEEINDGIRFEQKCD